MYREVRLGAQAAEAIGFDAVLNVTEITGSETFIHLDYHGAKWVGLVHGIQHLQPGQPLPVYLDPAHIYLFDANGALVSAAPYAEAA